MIKTIKQKNDPPTLMTKTIPTPTQQTAIQAAAFIVAGDTYLSSSPIYRRLAVAIADDLELLKVASEIPSRQSAPFLLLSAVHTLLLADTSHPLAQYFPTVCRQALSLENIYAPFRDFVMRNTPAIQALIRDAYINKTVVKRSACLRAMLVQCAQECGWQRLHLVDIGHSAGLNLLLDQWRINYVDYGTVGPVDANVNFSISLMGGTTPSLNPLPDILSRTGLDICDIDVSDPATERWILGNLFPDDPETFELTRKAFAIRKTFDIRQYIGNASQHIHSTLLDLPQGEPVVIMHSLTLSQIPPQFRQSIMRTLRDVAEIRPVARIGMELNGDHTILSIQPDVRGENHIVGKAEQDGTHMTWTGIARESQSLNKPS